MEGFKHLNKLCSDSSASGAGSHAAVLHRQVTYGSRRPRAGAWAADHHIQNTQEEEKRGKEAKVRSFKQWNSLLAKNCIGMKRLIRNYRFRHLSTASNLNVISDHQSRTKDWEKRDVQESWIILSATVGSKMFHRCPSAGSGMVVSTVWIVYSNFPVLF